MVVQVKVLKAFSGPTNYDHSSISFLVKSDYNLKEHINNAKEKLLKAMTKILENYKLEDHDVTFYHKLQVQDINKNIYLKTKRYELTNPKAALEDSSKELIAKGYANFKSHFINIIIKKDGIQYRMGTEEFSQICNTIMNDCININKTNNDKSSIFEDDTKEALFVDTTKKSRFDTYIKNIRSEEKRQRSRFKKQNERYLEILKKHINLLVS